MKDEHEIIMPQGKTNNDKRPLKEKIYYRKQGDILLYEYDSEIMQIEPWGKNSLRVRATKLYEIDKEDWALLTPQKDQHRVTINISAFGNAEITNGTITACCNSIGKITFKNQNGTILLEEYLRNRRDIQAETCSSLEIDAREFKPLIGGDYQITARFVSLSPTEHIFGMGQYQQPYMDLKGCELELAHRNSQASVPFYISSLGYGFLWNNPSIGRVTFGKNITTWNAQSSKKLDYWITANETPASIEEQYSAVTGRVPMMPSYAMGFWQCKLRYQTQEELLSVARKYKQKGYPLSVIVIDFFHWPLQGEWKFDPVYWPHPEAMIQELKDMGIELMVSIWPTVDTRSENYEEMKQKGYLIRTEKGMRISMDFMGNTIHYDATNPDARKYLWSKAKKNYYDKGIKIFWLDEAEPEYSVYDFENYRYFKGPNIAVGNIYPVMYAKTFFDGMKEAGQKDIINLLRCAWAGSQRYGALVWSGDIHSDFETLRNQFAAGLNMGVAGIPWWTTDIGGFHGGWIEDPHFHELLIRWLEYATFCPVMRLHGDREPHKAQFGTTGGAACLSGADNEVWSYGEKVESILTPYLFMRERLKAYITRLMKEAHEKGTPVMRMLSFEFPEDERCWEDQYTYMFGPDLLVSPVMFEGERTKKIYLPKGHTWTNVWTGETFEGKREIEVDAPLEQIPLFTRDKTQLPIKE